MLRAHMPLDDVRAAVNQKAPLVQYQYGAHFYKCPDCIKLLLDQGCDINACDPVNENTALMLAVRFGDREVVKLLLDRGADVNACNKHKNTALILALRFNHFHIANLLIEYGADVNAYGHAEGTALSFAAQNTETRFVALLLAHGANDFSALSEHNIDKTNKKIIHYFQESEYFKRSLLLIGASKLPLAIKEKYINSIICLRPKQFSSEIPRKLSAAFKETGIDSSLIHYLDPKISIDTLEEDINSGHIEGLAFAPRFGCAMDLLNGFSNTDDTALSSIDFSLKQLSRLPPRYKDLLFSYLHAWGSRWQDSPLEKLSEKLPDTLFKNGQGLLEDRVPLLMDMLEKKTPAILLDVILEIAYFERQLKSILHPVLPHAPKFVDDTLRVNDRLRAFSVDEEKIPAVEKPEKKFSTLGIHLAANPTAKEKIHALVQDIQQQAKKRGSAHNKHLHPILATCRLLIELATEADPLHKHLNALRKKSTALMEKGDQDASEKLRTLHFQLSQLLLDKNNAFSEKSLAELINEGIHSPSLSSYHGARQILINISCALGHLGLLPEKRPQKEKSFLFFKPHDANKAPQTGLDAMHAAQPRLEDSKPPLNFSSPH